MQVSVRPWLAFLLLGLALAWTTPQALAQELRIGYVDVERLKRDSAPAKAALARLQTEFDKREKALLEQQRTLKAASDKLDKEGTSMPDSERARRQRELLDQTRDFERRRREFQEDLNQRRTEEVAALLERAEKIVKQIAEQDHYDLILHDVVFAGPRVDMTERVIKALNTVAPGPPASAAR